MSAADLEKLSETVTYIISVEHKDYLTGAGPGKVRSDATPCPREVDQAQAQTWLREAMKNGWVSSQAENDFPRYIWIRKGERTYEARLSNSGRGEYKGYPILDSESPKWLP